MSRLRWVLQGVLGMVLITPAFGAEPVPIIFDTDMCGDCDDALALGMIHAFQSRGDSRLLAVTVSVNHPLAGPMVDVLNTFYGRPGIPIGVVGTDGVNEESEFLDLVIQRDGGAYRYPHALASGADAPRAVDVLRKALAGAPDGSVVVIQVGFSTNLAKLLDSPPDAHSPLTGKELVKQKVRLLSLMAGAFRTIEGNERYLEYNVERDVPAARKLASEWPTPRVWSGFEIGIALPYPATSIERDYGYVERHPVAEAYVRRNPPPHNRPTWDLTSVLYAVRPERQDFELSPPGTVTVEPDGFTRFTPGPEGKDRYLILKPGSEGRITEALVQLSSQPPSVAKGR